VDGVNTNDPQYGYQAARVNPEATAEVVVISGGFDAEYGEAMSGIVQVITKEGKEKPSGRIKYTTDEFMPKGLNYGYNQVEGSIGSSFKLGKDRLGYFVSPELDFIGDYNPREYKLPHHNRNDYQLTGKLDYVHSGLKLTGSGFLSREQYELQPNTPDDENNLGFKYDLDHYLSERDRTRTLNLNLDHMLRPNLFYTVSVGYFYDQRVEAVRDLAREATERDYNKRFWEDYIFKGEDSVMSRDSVIYDMRRFYDEQRNDVTLNPYGVTGLFYGVGDYRVFLANWSSVITYKGDLTYNIGKTHEFKTGVEVRQNDIARRYNSLPSDPNPFVDAFDYKPLNAAVYVQDRMDFEDLVLRPGLRLDYLDPNAYKKADPANVEDTTEVQALPKYKLSPRLGVSFPITERSKFRFSYGQFFQTPAYQYLFDDISTAAYLRGNNIIGNPDLQAQQTVAYELGVETELSRIFSLDVTAYYKDIYNLLGVRYQSALPIGYYPYENEDYGNVRGIEIALDKALSSYWSSELSYSLSMARGTASYATEWYYERYRYGIDPITGQEMEPPKSDYFLDFDERHTVKADLTLQFPHDFSAVILRDFQGTLLFTFGSGLPYSVRELKQGLNSGQIIGEHARAL
jgi:outer membrane receptor protein involved in Fe transport